MQQKGQTPSFLNVSDLHTTRCNQESYCMNYYYHLVIMTPSQPTFLDSLGTADRKSSRREQTK